MADFLSTSDLSTVLLTDAIWVGRGAAGPSTIVARPLDEVRLKFTCARTRTTQTNIFDQQIFHYPETLHDKNFISAILHPNMCWDIRHPSQSQPPQIDPSLIRRLPIYYLPKGEKIICVKMLQDQRVCYPRDADGREHLPANDDMGNTYVVHIEDFFHQDSMRTFFLPNLPSAVNNLMEKLIDDPYLTVDKKAAGTYINVNTEWYSLMAVHIAFAQLLLSRPASLKPGRQHEGERQLFIDMTAEAYTECDACVQEVLLKFAGQWDLTDDVMRRVNANTLKLENQPW